MSGKPAGAWRPRLLFTSRASARPNDVQSGGEWRPICQYRAHSRCSSISNRTYEPDTATTAYELFLSTCCEYASFFPVQYFIS